MTPRIEFLKDKKLVGKRMKMSLVNNKTMEIWRSFMPRRKEIKNIIGTDLYSLQMYDPLYFDHFDPHPEFEKWAATEVTDFNTIPEDMERLDLPGGMYVVFLYK